MVFLALLALGAKPPLTEESDQRYPLGPQLRVLAADVKSPSYRKLVMEKMLDLAAEWQRVATGIVDLAGLDQYFADMAAAMD